MTEFIGTLRRLREGRDAVPPFLDDPPRGMLSVARDLFEHPETVRLPDGRQIGYAETGRERPMIGPARGLDCRGSTSAGRRLDRGRRPAGDEPLRPG